MTERGPMCKGEDQSDAYAAGYLAGLNLDDPRAHPWATTNRVARRFQAKRVSQWEAGYDAGNAERIRRRAAEAVEP